MKRGPDYKPDYRSHADTYRISDEAIDGDQPSRPVTVGAAPSTDDGTFVRGIVELMRRQDRGLVGRRGPPDV